MQVVRRSALVWLLVLCTASIAIAQPTAVVSRNVNLRATPSTAQTPIRLLTAGEALTLVTTTPVNGYYHVRTPQNEDGWVYRTFVQIEAAPPAPPPPSPPPPPPPTCGPGTVIVLHPSCPAVGTHGQGVAYSATSDTGLRNMAKRHLPDPACTPKPLTFDDLRSLQNYIDNTFADARTTKTTFQPTRSLKNIETFEGPRSEGDAVQLSAYLVVARDEHSESVNCAGSDGVDIHINVGPKSLHPTEFDGVVAEMIPQLPRPAGWNSTTLNRLAGKQILVVGALTYDNEHFVNDNPAKPKGGQPERFALWEIHPITALYVCPAGDGCDPAQPSQWVSLTDWAKNHP
jgi:hypothetical protein